MAIPPTRGWSIAALGAAAALVASGAAADDAGWRLAETMIAEACRAPVVTYFDADDGRRLEKDRLDFSAERVVWSQRALFADGEPIFEAELSLDLAVPEGFSQEAAIRVGGEHVDVSQAAVIGGSLAYRLTAEGGRLEPAPHEVRINPMLPRHAATYRFTPTGPEATLTLVLDDSPCEIRWTWRRAPAAAAPPAAATMPPVGEGKWELAETMIAEACQAPLVTYFSAADGRQLEADRLEVSAERVAWTRRAYLADGEPLFESELTLAMGVPARLAAAAELRLAGALVLRSGMAGLGGSLTYSLTAAGARLDPPAETVRIDAAAPRHEQAHRITPTGPETALILIVHDSPCEVRWTWRGPAPKTPVAEAPAVPGAAEEAVAVLPPAAPEAELDAVQQAEARVEEPPPAEPAQAPAATANRLIVAARMAWNRAQEAEGEVRRAALEEVRDLLWRVIEEHPDADHAVALIGGGEVAGISIPMVGEALEAALAPPSPWRRETLRVPMAAPPDRSPHDLIGTHIFNIDVSARTTGDHHTRRPALLALEPAGLALDGPGGAIVVGVEAGGTGAAAGLRPGDVIVAVNGPEEDGFFRIARTIAAQDAGADLTLELYRFDEGTEGLERQLRERADQGDVAAMTALAQLGLLGVIPGVDEAAALQLLRRAGELGSVRALVQAAVVLVGSADDESEAARLFRMAAEAGDLISMIAMVQFLLNEDEEAASRWEAQAMTLAKQAAEAGDIEAMALLGKKNLSNERENQNLAQAVRWLRQAAERGYQLAARELGNLYRAGTRGVVQDDDEALRWYRLAARLQRQLVSADTGDHEVFKTLADSYERAGEYDEVLRWYRRAADGGDVGAMSIVARMYGLGDAIDQDLAQAAHWYRRAAEAGDPLAMWEVAWAHHKGQGVAVDMAEAVRWYGRAAEAGNVSAMRSLAHLYDNGDDGVEQDRAEALRWHKRVAGEGDVWAMVNVGRAYEWGRGTAKDEAEGMRWYRRAAELGNASAMRRLAIGYQVGRGVNRDLHAAADWYERAVEAGDVLALSGLGWVYRYGHGGKPRDLAEAVRLFRIAADQGDGSGLFNLGLMYRRGLGVRQDTQEAIRLFRRALEVGDDRARSRLDELKVSHYDPQEVQRLLAELGFDAGQADGRIGRRTRDAIRAFQGEHGLAVDGEPSVELVIALRRQIAARVARTDGG